MNSSRSIGRQDKILHLLSQQQSISVQELSRRLRVSEWTVRRDLVALEKRGQIARYHGGVTICTTSILPPPITPRTDAAAEACAVAKQRIGHTAAQLLRSGQHVVISAGTTTLQVALALCRLPPRRLEIVTNAPDIAKQLATMPDIAVTCTGGDVHGDYYTLTGPVAERVLRSYFFDVAIIGVSGLTARQGLTVNSQLNAVTMDIMVRHATQVIVVADQSKLGRVSFAHLATLDAIDTLVTDAPPPDELNEQLAAAGVTVLIAAAHPAAVFESERAFDPRSALRGEAGGI
jgi:DeoR/GlpR family transcriptional regulator of sugar metabolism